MPGVMRPYTLVDVLATINGTSQNATNNQNVVTGLGLFVEPSETVPLSDSVTTSLQTAPATWDNGVWGGTQWF